MAPPRQGSRADAQGIETPSALAALPLGLAALAALALAGAGILRAPVALAAAAGCAVFALLPVLIASHHRWTLRDRADELLRKGVAVNPESSLLQWRAAELTSERERRSLARSFRRIVGELDGRLLPGAVPLNRAAARPQIDLLRGLAGRLQDTGRPVTPQGVARTERLLRDGLESPLYALERADELEAELVSCLRALEPQQGEHDHV